ncbi:hypothetical protein J3A83DRAFT_4372542 [Scleroderma citrinum]
MTSSPFLTEAVNSQQWDRPSPLNLGPSLRNVLLPEQPYVLPNIETHYDLDGTWSASILQGFGMATVDSDEDNFNATESLEEVPRSLVCSPSTMHLPMDVQLGDILSGEVGAPGRRENGHSASNAFITNVSFRTEFLTDSSPSRNEHTVDTSRVEDNHSLVVNSKSPPNSHTISEPGVSKLARPSWKKLIGRLLNRKEHTSYGRQKKDLVVIKDVVIKFFMIYLP